MNIELNIGLVRGVLTLILFVAFMTLWAWAWNKKRKQAFDLMARLPLDDQESTQEPPR